jgi:hypothetical protein
MSYTIDHVQMLQKEVADLRAQLAAEQALRVVKDAALAECYRNEPLVPYAKSKVLLALEQTYPTAALDAKIADAELRVLEEVLIIADEAGDESACVYNSIDSMIEQRKEKAK